MSILYTTRHFTVQSCDDCFIPGHLVIHPITPVQSLQELSPEALQNSGPILALCHQAVQTIVQPTRIYTLSFCEVLPRLHFHVFPRTELLGRQFNAYHEVSGDTVNGALFFDWARKHCQEKSVEYGDVLGRIRVFFDEKSRDGHLSLNK